MFESAVKLSNCVTEELLTAGEVHVTVCVCVCVCVCDSVCVCVCVKCLRIKGIETTEKGCCEVY